MKISKEAAIKMGKELHEHALKYGFPILEKKPKQKKKATSK